MVLLSNFFLSSFHYLDVSVFFVDNDFKLQSRTLAVKPLANESHDAEFVLSQFELVLEEYKMSSTESISVISDQGSNMTGCLGLSSKYPRDDCFCHLISTVVKRVLFKVKRQRDGHSSSVYKYQEKAPSVFKLNNASFKLCEHLKRTGCNKNLPQTTKKAFEVRWTSLYTMLFSSHKVYKEIKHLCNINDTLSWLQGIDADLLKELVNLLEPFKNATEILEQYKQPTIHLVIYCRNGLVEHLQKDSTDSAPIKKYLLEKLNYIYKWKIKPLHVAAALLDPIQKRVLISKMGCCLEQIEDGKKYLKETMLKIPHGREERFSQISSQARKKNKLSNSMDSLLRMRS